MSSRTVSLAVTVRVHTAVFPEGRVADIVVVPGAKTAIIPYSLTVATSSLLLSQRISSIVYFVLAVIL